MLEMVAFKRLPPQIPGIMISMEPAVAALLALGLLGEHLSASQWLAIGLIVAASMGCAFTAQRGAQRPPSGAAGLERVHKTLFTIFSQVSAAKSRTLGARR